MFLIKWGKNRKLFYSILLKVSNRNTRTRCKICAKLKMKNQSDAIDVVLVSFLLTLNIFHALFLCFYWWLWSFNCKSGCCILFSFNDYVTDAFFTKIVCDRYENTMQHSYIYKRAWKIKIIFLILDLWRIIREVW